jgi:hypothetical protein
MIAWFLGVLSVPILTLTHVTFAGTRLAPTAVVAYFVAFLTYRILAALKTESKVIAIPEAVRL